MKAIVKIGLWKAIAFLAVVISFSCSSCEDPIPPIPPVDPVKAVAIIQPAVNVTKTSATVVAKVLPNEDGTKAAFEIKANGQSVWSSYALPLAYNGKDTIKVTFDLFDLKVGTAYDFRIKAVNKAGETFSEISSFETYAVSDFDGNLYHIVKIGTQVWLKENFKGTHFANGDPIPNITGQTEWEAATSPAYCYYNNDIKNAETYGALYNWYVASDSRELISGFHVPSEEEWYALAERLGGLSVAGGAMKEAGFTHWIQPNKGATNSSGFTGLPAGSRTETFGHLSDSASFWVKDKFFGMPNVGSVFLLGCSHAQLTDGGDGSWKGRSLRVVQN